MESEWSSAQHGQCDETFIQRPGSMSTIGAPPPNPQYRNIHTMPKLCVGQIHTSKNIAGRPTTLVAGHGMSALCPHCDGIVVAGGRRRGGVSI